MKQTVLITGSDGPLAKSLAARYHATTDALALTPERVETNGGLRADEVWWLSEGAGDEDDVRQLLASLSALGAGSFYLVGTAARDFEGELLERCAACNVRCLVFRTPHLLGMEASANGRGRSEIGRFLYAFDALVAEVEERLPGYFRGQPLRCPAPEGAVVNLAEADEVARALLSISRTGPQGYHLISAERPTPFADLCRQVGRAWGVELTTVADDQTLDVVGRRLRDRLTGIDLLDRAPTNPPGIETHRVANPDEEAQQSFLRALREHSAKARETVKARLAAMPELMKRHTVAGIPALAYNAVGRGEPPLIAVNAIGQGIAIWLPLLERLSRKRRIIIWEMRQADPDGRPVTFAEHCQDLHAVLQHEGANASDLLGWCTGAKLAARYCRTHPGAVRSLVFLSGSFRHPGRAPEFDTAYERNLEAMLKAVVRQPSLAERLRVVFAAAPSDGTGDDQPDGGATALRALTELQPALQPEVRRPFRDAHTLALYARQHMEFWSHDETATASDVRVPVLGIAGEYDEVVSPSGFRAALNRFPLARYTEIAGATHHCFYERPDLVADLIEDFLARVQSIKEVKAACM